ncbi:MAG TPA: phosphoribosylglycinamide formyltransferase [Acidimicrobiia bacterium]|nr:phosphoribosylglycinamide formyltransferase [Acidimicrobiia bacterium]
MLASGSGSNLQALIDDQGEYRIALVLSDKPGSRALERAEQAGLPTAVVAWPGERGVFTTAICDAVAAAGAELMVLAGFMRILGREAIDRFPDRILNIHPSLLPAFPGAHAVESALEHGVKVTGVTVHFVDEEVDHGPIIAQVPVPVAAGDDRDSLHARLQAEEHRIYPAVVAGLARGEITLEERTVRWRKT